MKNCVISARHDHVADNDEALMTNAELITKSEWAAHASSPPPDGFAVANMPRLPSLRLVPNRSTVRRQHARFGLRHSVIPSSFDIRHSSFSHDMYMPRTMVA